MPNPETSLTFLYMKLGGNLEDGNSEKEENAEERKTGGDDEPPPRPSKSFRDRKLSSLPKFHLPAGRFVQAASPAKNSSLSNSGGRWDQNGGQKRFTSIFYQPITTSERERKSSFCPPLQSIHLEGRPFARPG
jgi:hypothetical protein